MVTVYNVMHLKTAIAPHELHCLQNFVLDCPIEVRGPRGITMAMDTPTNDLMTVAEVQDQLRYETPRPVYALIREGRLPAIRLGRHFLIRRSDLSRLLAAAVRFQVSP